MCSVASSSTLLSAEIVCSFAMAQSFSLASAANDAGHRRITQQQARCDGKTGDKRYSRLNQKYLKDYLKIACAHRLCSLDDTAINLI